MTLFPPLLPAAVKQRIHYTCTEMLGEIFCCCLKGSLLKIFFKDLFVCLFFRTTQIVRRSQ